MLFVASVKMRVLCHKLNKKYVKEITIKSITTTTKTTTTNISLLYQFFYVSRHLRLEIWDDFTFKTRFNLFNFKL